jgi:hypothetical protein
LEISNDFRLLRVFFCFYFIALHKLKEKSKISVPSILITNFFSLFSLQGTDYANKFGRLSSHIFMAFIASEIAIKS